MNLFNLSASMQTSIFPNIKKLDAFKNKLFKKIISAIKFIKVRIKTTIEITKCNCWF